MNTTTEATPNHVEGKRIVLEELHRLTDASVQASQALDTKFQSLLGAASLIVTLVGAVQIAVLRQQAGDVAVALLAVIFLLLVAMFGLSFRAWRPRERSHPISVDWGEMKRVYFGKDEDSVLTQIISDHLRFFQLSRDINKEKAALFDWALVLFFVIIVALLAMVFVGIRG